MLKSIKFGTTCYPLSNPPANTTVLAVDYPSRKMFLLDSKGITPITELATSYLFDKNGKIKPNFLPDAKEIVIPTKLSQFENDVKFIDKDVKNLTFFLTKTETLAAIANAIVGKADKTALAALESRVDALAGSYVYIGKIDIAAPTQAELTAKAIELKGSVQVGYVLVDANDAEWYFDGSTWNDFGTPQIELTWDNISNKPDLVVYTEDDHAIVADSVKLVDGEDEVQVVEIVDNKVKVGNVGKDLNFVSDGQITINGDNVVSTLSDVETAKEEAIEASAQSLTEHVGSAEDITELNDAISNLTTKIENI